MRRHVKASSAGSTLSQGNSLGSIGRGALATRASSRCADGSGAPSHRASIALALVMAAVGLLAVAPLGEAKVVVSGFGTSSPAGGLGGLGGQFGTARGIAVNESGNGAPQGTAYVVDSSSRIQRFSSKGAFQRAWGQNVVGRNERQSLTLSTNRGKSENESLGSFTLTLGAETTSPIAVEANVQVGGEWFVGYMIAPIENALAALPSVGAGNVTVAPIHSSADYQITFTGSLAGTDLPPLSADASALVGGEAVSMATIENGRGGSLTGFEICTESSLCREGETTGATANGGQLNDPQGIAVDQSTGNVYVTEAGNRRVSEFDPDGDFIRAWGWDVITSGQPNDTGTGFEICTVTSECKQGASGANGGELGGTIGYPVVDSSGNVWVPDATNRRIQKFDSSGSFIAAYGYNVDAFGGGGTLEKCTSTAVGACQAGTAGSGAGQFSAGYPTDIAFDSSGDLFAIDAGNNRVQKFDPTLLASATTFGASTFSTYTTTAPERMIATQGGAGLAFSLNNNKTANPTERQVIEVDPADAGVEDTSLVGAGLGNVEGLGTDATSGDLYATTPSGASPRKVLVLGDTPLAPPFVSMGDVDTKTDTTATFTAKVDSGLGLVDDCKFQYSLDQLNWTDVSLPGCDAIEPGSGKQTFNASVTGLVPNTRYFVRASVARPLLANSTVTTAVKTFETDAPPPVISDPGATEVADTSARLIATIDPRHSPTGYAFEYGTTPGLGSSTAPLAIGAGTQPITVSQVVGGLSKDTTYYYRVTATNLTGPTTTGLHTLHTRATPLPAPDDRRYEMVSPPNKNYGDVVSTAATLSPEAGVSPDGNAAGFCTTALFGEPAGRMSLFCAPYVSHRTAGGWQTSSPFPQYCKIDPIAGNDNTFLQAFLSLDFKRFVVDKPESAGCSIPPLDPAAPLASVPPVTEPGEPSYNLYLDDPTTAPTSYRLMNPAAGGDFFGEPVIGGSEDLGHVFYMSMHNQSAEPDSPPEASFRKIYEWERDGEGACTEPGGCVRLVTVDPSNEPFETESSGAPAPEGVGYFADNSEVSTDGSRIFFQNPAQGGAPTGAACNVSRPGCELYMREGGTTTFDVSESECTASCGSPQTKNDPFLEATPSGRVAFFASCAKLTDGAPSQASCISPYNTGGEQNGVELYRWDRDGAPGHRLIDLTVDHEPGDGERADFRGMVGTSEDGNTAYFVTRGQIVAGEPTAPAEKLYRWRYNGGSPIVDYLGPYQYLDYATEINWRGDRRHVTPDGRYLMIFTKLGLDPAADRDAAADLYRWDEEDGWICISCQRPGAPSAGDVDLFQPELSSNSLFPSSLVSLEPAVSMSDDGRRIFFATPDALVPGDVNGEVECPVDSKAAGQFTSTHRAFVYTCEDVYEWNDGTVSLVSPGTGGSASWLISGTPSGRDVFFYTAQRLVGWDTDTSRDIYDARVGGGFPEPPPQPPSCEGESCRGAGTGAPAPAGAGTAVFQGQGNPAPKHKAAGKHHKKRHHKHQQRAKHNRRAGR